MGDVQWEKAWLQTRLEMPHSYSWEQVCGLQNWPTLLQTLGQSRKVGGPLLKAYQTVKLRWGDQDIPMWICQPNNPSSLIPQEVSSKDASGDGGSDHQPSPHWPSRGWECNRCQRDQRPQSPQFPSPFPDCGFESNWSSLSTASLMSSRSDRSDRSRHPRWGRQYQEEGACMKINLPIFKDNPELEVGFNGISMCRVQ